MKKAIGCYRDSARSADPGEEDDMQAIYRQLGHWIFRHRIGVGLFWLVVLIGAGVAARRAPTLLDAGSLPLAETASARVELTLGRDFAQPFAQSSLH